MKRLVRPIIEWLIWSCTKGRNEDTSAAETDMTVVTLPFQKLKSWQKLRLEGTIEKWPESQRVAAPQINAGSVVAAAVSLSVSQAESLFVRGANTAMIINSAISGDSATGRKNSRRSADWILWCSKILEADRKGSRCNGGAHHCGHRNKETTS